MLHAIVLLLSTALGTSGAQEQRAPAGYWRFDEATGTIAADAAGHAPAAALQGGASWIEPGKSGTALHLAGGGSLDIPTPVVDTSKSFTVSAWVRVNETGGYQTFASIDGARISGFFLQLRADTGAFAFTMPAENAGVGGAVASAGKAPRIGVWYHLTGVHDAAAKTIALYVNGVFQEAVPFESSWRATGHTWIGRAKFDEKAVDFARADIDEVKFYDYARVDPREFTAIAKETHAGESTLTLDVAKATRRISPTLYGLMIEDINHSIDGGLYGELIRNRAFKDDPRQPAQWTLAGEDGAGTMALDPIAAVTGTALATSLRLHILHADREHGFGVANDGYWGIPVKPRTRYRVSFYAKADGYRGPISVGIESQDGRITFARATANGVGTSWKLLKATITTGSAPATTDARFVLRAHGPGILWLSQVSLFGPTWNNRPNGTRPDLMDLLKDMKQTFLRLPGGNFLEGNTIAERFEWKATVGPIEQRPGHPNPWGYRSSDGFGLLEYLQWCEDLNLEPVLAVFAGYALRGEHVEPGPKLEPFVQEVLDEIEYVTGGTDTRWGALRAKNGHPAPFKLTYVEIGNEDGFDRSGSYEGRYAQFHDAIKAKYPALRLIASAPVKSRRPDVLDEHFYRTANQMAADSGHYDRYDRAGPKIFVGEWASQDVDRPWIAPGTKGPTPTLNSALGDAAWMTGMERNSDVVILSSYAPLLVNVNPGARQWAVNLIGFDALRSFGSPSYFAQQMFAEYLGDVVVPAELSDLSTLHACASRDTKTGTVYVKVVNRTDTAVKTVVSLNGLESLGAQATAVTLTSARPSDTNTLDAPKRVAPVKSRFRPGGNRFEYSFAAYSVTVLVLEAR